MNLKEEDVVSCLCKAKEMIEHYNGCAHHPRERRSIDDLVWICTTYLERPVEIRELKLSGTGLAVLGMFAALDNGTYEIYLVADLSEREQRFVTCKELFHVILDEERSRNMDLVAHLEESQASFTIADSEPTSAVAFEALAEIGAMEFLFPYQRRKEEIEAAGGTPDYEALAKKYGIPRPLIEEYLTDHSMTEFGKIEW